MSTWTFALLLGCWLAGPTDATAEDDLRLQVQQLVRQLDARQLAQREAAEARLLELGPNVLGLLPQPDQRTSAEVQQRLGRIRQRLQRALADAAARPSLVTLRGRQMPLSKVLAAFEQQSGNKIVDFRKRFGQEQDDPPLDVDFDNTPFWQALDTVLDQAGLDVYGYGEKGAISVVGRAAARLPRSSKACYSGAFRLEPLRIIALRDLLDPHSQSLRLTLAAAWEPRLKPITLKQKMAELIAVDENGNSLAPEDTAAQLEVPVGAAASVEFDLPLKLPPRNVEEIASLKGKLLAVVPGKIETFTFDDLTKAKNVEKRIAGVTVTLERLQRNNQTWQVIIRVRFDQAGDALESYRGWILDNPAYLEGPDGQPIPFDSLETTLQTNNEIGIAYLFVLDAPPEKHKFVYKTPGTIITTGLDYEIKGVTLP